jgi:hypothetical protein
MAGEKVINIISIEAIVLMTELAVHFDGTLLVEDTVALLLADGFQGAQRSLPRAAATEGDGLGIEQAHSFFVEQAMEHGFAVQGQ